MRMQLNDVVPFPLLACTLILFHTQHSPLLPLNCSSLLSALLHNSTFSMYCPFSSPPPPHTHVRPSNAIALLHSSITSMCCPFCSPPFPPPPPPPSLTCSCHCLVAQLYGLHVLPLLLPHLPPLPPPPPPPPSLTCSSLLNAIALLHSSMASRCCPFCCLICAMTLYATMLGASGESSARALVKQRSASEVRPSSFRACRRGGGRGGGGRKGGGGLRREGGEDAAFLLQGLWGRGGRGGGGNRGVRCGPAASGPAGEEGVEEGDGEESKGPDWKG